MTLLRSPGEGHCPRPHLYKLGALQLDLRDMTSVLGVKRLPSPSSSAETSPFAAVVDVQVDSSGVYICKSIVNYLRHGNYIGTRELRAARGLPVALGVISRCVFNPGLSQLNRDFHPKVGASSGPRVQGHHGRGVRARTRGGEL